jgi:protein TonB
MDIKGNKNYYDQSMDDIVFDTKNKGYGAYVLRGAYQKHLLRAMAISIGIFVFSLYTPKMAKAIGLFKEKQEEAMDTTIITLVDPPSADPDEPPPPPPPPAPPVVRPTERFVEMQAVEKEKAEDPPPTIEEMDKKDIGTEKVEGEPTDEPPPIVETPVGTGKIIDEKIYKDVDQKAYFIGGPSAFADFVNDNIKYPQAEKEEGITGQTTVSFVVNMQGEVLNVKVANSSGYDALDKEAMRVISKASKRFKPAKFNGNEVKSYCVVTITFDLDNE